MKTIPFKQTAFIGTISSSIPHKNVAYERFTEKGPIAILPLDSHDKLAFVWTVLDNELDEMNKLVNNPELFLIKLKSEFASKLGVFSNLENISIFPLNLIYMPKVIYHRSVFIGNAAQTLHPIAGQGFNLGIRDVASLIDHCLNYELGEPKMLYSYMKKRENDRNSIMVATTSLVHIFSTDKKLLVLLRQLGLGLLNISPPLKTKLKHFLQGLK